jgi:hypothetical protein
MSFTLIDQGNEGYELNANVWTWKAVVEIIRSFDILGEGELRQMSYNATGVKLPVEQAREIGERIRKEILPRLTPDKRMFADLTVTDAPDDMTLYRDGDEQWKNYSVSYEWLEEFSDFCTRSKGFQVF